MGRKLRAGLAAEDRWALEEMRTPEWRAADERRTKAAYARHAALEASNAAANDMGLSAAKNKRAADACDEAARLADEAGKADDARYLREQAAQFRGMKGY